MATEETLKVRFTHTNEDKSLKSIYYPETTIDQVHGLNNTLQTINNNITLQGASITANNDSIKALQNDLQLVRDDVDSLLFANEVSQHSIPIPSQASICVYNHGATLEPSWKDYDTKTANISSGTRKQSLAGTYTVRFSTKNGMYFPNGKRTVDVEWTISPYTIKNVVVKNNIFTFNESNQSIEFESDTIGYNITGDISGFLPARYQVIIQPNNTDTNHINYVWSDPKYPTRKVYEDWSIVPHENLPIPVQNEDIIYNGKEQSILSHLANYDENIMNLYRTSVGTDAGNYTAAVSLYNPKGYKWAGANVVGGYKYIPWTIKPETIDATSLKLTKTDFEFTGDYITIGANEIENFDSNKMSLTGNLKDMAVGNDNKVSIKTINNNYLFMDGETSLKAVVLNWNIIEQKITNDPSLKQSEFVFDRTTHTVEATNFNSSVMSLGGVKQAKVAGKYQAIIKIRGSNYTFSNGLDTLGLDWEIKKEEVDLPKLKKDLPVYTGSNINLVNYLDNYDSLKSSISSNVKRDAGTYTATIIHKDKGSQIWSDDQTNDDRPFSWIIKPKPIEDPSFVERSFTYDGNNKKVAFSSSDSVNYSVLSGSKISDTFSEIGIHHVSVRPKINYEWKDSEDKQKIYDLTWEIVDKNKFNVPIQKVKPEYNPNGINIIDPSYWDGYNSTDMSIRSGTNDTNVNGTHQVIFSLKKTGTSWSDGTKDNKTVDFVIVNKTINPTASNTLYGWTGGNIGATLDNETGVIKRGYVAADAGSYTMTISPDTNYAFPDNKTSININWKIASLVADPKLRDTETKVQGTSFVYKPSGNKVELVDSTNVIIDSDSTTQQTGVTGYVCFVYVSLKNNCVWQSSKDTSRKTIKWIVIPESISTDITISPNKVTYDGKAHGISHDCSMVPNIGFFYSLSGNDTNRAIDVGEYKFSIKPQGPSYVWAGTNNDYSTLKEIKWTIEPVNNKNNNPVLKAATDLPVYDGSTTFSLSECLDGYNSNIMSLKGTTTLNVPTVANATVELTNKNYTWSDGTSSPKSIQWSIRPATITQPTVTSSSLPQFNPTNQVIYNVGNYLLPTLNTNLVSLGGTSSSTQAGTEYTASLKIINTNYAKWSNSPDDNIRTVKWSIKPYTIDVPELTETNIVFDNKQHTVLPNPSNNVDYSGDTVGTEVKKNYAIKVTPKINYSWSNGTRSEKTLYWTISSNSDYVFDIPRYIGDLTYDDGRSVSVAEPSLWSGYNSSYMSLISGGSTDIASISTTAVFSLKSSSYKWSNIISGTTTTRIPSPSGSSVSVNYKLNRKTVNVPTFNNNHTYTYSKNCSISATSTGILNDYNSAIMSTNTFFTNCSEQDVIVKLSNDNYCWPDGSTSSKNIKASIHPLKISKPVKDSNKSFTYDGNSKDVTDLLTSTINSDYIHLGGNTAILAAKINEDYEATFSLLNTTNTKWSDNTTDPVKIKWNIKRSILSAASDIRSDYKSLTFSGGNRTVYVYNSDIVSFDNNNITGGVQYAKDVGTYNAVIYVNTLNSNDRKYMFDDGSIRKTVSWEITPYIFTSRPTWKTYSAANVSKEEVTYNGSVYNVSQSSFNYFPESTENGANISGDTSKTNAGTYTITFNYGNNYRLKIGNSTYSTDSTTWTIKKSTVTAELSLSSASVTTRNNYSGYIYTGSALYASIKPNNGVKIDLTQFNRTQVTDAGGPYYINVTTSSDNYELSNKDKYLTWVVDQAVISNPALTNNDLTYDGTNQTVTPADSSKYSIKSGSSAKNAGTYSAIVSSKTGYVFDSNNSIQKTLTWTIKPKTLDSASDWNNWDTVRTYAGTAIYAGNMVVTNIGGKVDNISITTTDLSNYYSTGSAMRDTSYTWASTATNVGKYKFNVDAGPNQRFNDGSRYHGLRWIINPYTVKGGYTFTQNYLYTGSNIYPTNNVNLNTTTSFQYIDRPSIKSGSGNVTFSGTVASPSLNAINVGHYYFAIDYGPNQLQTLFATDTVAGSRYVYQHWYIYKITIDPALTNNDLTYDGTNQTVTPADSSKYSIKSGSSAKNAGTYSAIVSSKTGYVFDSNNSIQKTLTWTIKPKTLDSASDWNNWDTVRTYAGTAIYAGNMVVTNIGGKVDNISITTTDLSNYYSTGSAMRDTSYTWASTATNVGKYKFNVDAGPNQRFNDGSRYHGLRWIINPYTIDGYPKFSNDSSYKEYSYTGKNIKPINDIDFPTKKLGNPTYNANSFTKITSSTYDWTGNFPNNDSMKSSKVTPSTLASVKGNYKFAISCSNNFLFKSGSNTYRVQHFTWKIK